MLLGLVMVPYPGPGWLVVFAGLAILATEFAVAAHLLERGRAYYEGWIRWLKRQHWSIRLLVLSLTGLVVIVTLWLVNAFGIMIALLGLPWEFLVSPLAR